jgi:hypothetical protein
VYAVTRGAQYGQRRVRVLGLEIVGEGVDEQHDVGAGVGGRGRLAQERVAAPPWQRPARRQARPALGQPLHSGQRFAQVGEPRYRSGPRRQARQVGDQAILERETVRALPVVLELDLHFRHVDAGRAVATATLAADAQRQRRAHRFTGEIRAELTR